jgi:hypothetical protein
VLQLSADTFCPLPQLRAAFAPQVIIMLGVPPQALGIAALVRYCTPNPFGGCILLPGPGLQEMEARPELRKELFDNGLKPAFGL